MDLVAIIGLNVLSGIASLVLISLGLAIIFGMMRIINLAHGEFLMLGAYATVVSTNHGVNVWISMLVVSPVFVGLVGLLVERTLIRFLYGRLVDTMLATWGLSLFIVGARHHHLRQHDQRRADAARRLPGRGLPVRPLHARSWPSWP